jgi:hypothetical protein
VVDLLPNEHRAACLGGAVRGVQVSFVERNGKAAGHEAKLAKGRLARHMLMTGGHPMEALQSWTDARFDLSITPVGP